MRWGGLQLGGASKYYDARRDLDSRNKYIKLNSRQGGPNDFTELEGKFCRILDHLADCRDDHVTVGEVAMMLK